MGTVSRPRSVMTGLILLSFLGALDHTIVASALPTLAGQFGAVEHMSWIIVGFTLASTVALPVFGRAADVYGARAMLVLAAAIFIAGSVWCGFSADITQMTLARTLQGIGAAGMMLLPHTIIGLVAAPRDRAQMMSFVGATFPVAIVVGPLLGGILTDTVGWQWIFWIYVPVGLVSIVLAYIGIPRLPGRVGARFDLLGCILTAVVTVGLTMAATWGAGEEGWLGLSTLIAIAVSVTAGVALVGVERRAIAPVLPIGLLRSPAVSGATALSIIVGVGLFAVVAYLPTYVQMAYRVSATTAGTVPLSMVFGMLAGTLISGPVVSRTGRYRWAILTGAALGAGGLITLAFVPTSLGLLLPTVILGLVGLGTGLYMQLVVVIAQSDVARGDIGAVTTLVTLSRQIASTIATALIGSWIGTFVAGRLGPNITTENLSPASLAADEAMAAVVSRLYVDALMPIFLILAGVIACAILTAAFIPSRALDEGQAKEVPPVLDTV
jgi:MFS family permease